MRGTKKRRFYKKEGRNSDTITKSNRGRSKLKRSGMVTDDLRQKGLRVNECQDHEKWIRRIKEVIFDPALDGKSQN